MYKVITLTGLDRTGKATQAQLLARALTPAKLISFPDYDHWSGQIIRAILSEEEFEIRRWQGGTQEVITSHQEQKEPYLFQALHFANCRAHYARLKAGQEQHHWVMDRGPACALAYGVVDGCDARLLQDLAAYQIPEDLVLVMLGGPYARPGEVPDMNERNSAFQSAIAERYRELCRQGRGNWAPVPVGLASGQPKLAAITMIHHMICQIVDNRLDLGTGLRPLTPSQVEAILAEGPRGVPVADAP